MISSDPAVSPVEAGKPLSRVDGRLKVTGGARYSAEFSLPDMAYGVLLTSTAPKGRMTGIDTQAAEKAPGVQLVMTHLNAAQVPGPGDGGTRPKTPDKKMSLLQSDEVRYNFEPIGVVVADTFEHAKHAAELVRVQYEGTENPAIDLEKNLPAAITPPEANKEATDNHRGDLAAGMQQATAKLEQSYTTPYESHHPMEPHATIAHWEEGNQLTIYDSTQGVHSHKARIAMILGLKPENVRVVCYFLGGGFGCKGSMWSHVVLTAMAARQAGRPVKLVLERQQMAGPVGFRSQTKQDMKLGATRDGQLTGMRHASTSQSSSFDLFVEPAALASRLLYTCPNQETSHRVVRLDLGTPCQMRAPGEASGMFALEASMDELSYVLGMDPLELRQRNYAESDPEENKPWSSKSLKECYKLGAEKFGWSKRNPQPRSMHDGKYLVGYGMATATYPVNRSPAHASAKLTLDGKALVTSGCLDIGTGTYTIMTQLAADSLGLPVDRVKFELGDTRLPEAPTSGGSQTAASVGSAVRAAGIQVINYLIDLAVADAQSPLHGLNAEDVVGQDGRLIAKDDATRAEAYEAVLSRSGQPAIELVAESKPGDEKQHFTMQSFGAQFCEVRVDPDLGEVRVTRFLGVYGVGRVLNEKTAQSQLKGGIVMGIGMALHEHTVFDENVGRAVNPNLAEYHVPVAADIPEIEVIFVPEEDTHINPIGAKGVGELGITGTAAAVANAIYHATGKRIRDLPISPDKLLA